MSLSIHSVLSRFLFLLVCLLSSSVRADSWILSVDDQTGLPALSNGGASAMSSDFAFWGRNWDWTDLSSEFKVIAPYEYSMVGADQALNFSLTSHIKRTSPRQLVLEFDLDARSAASDIIGGGIVFKLDPTKFGSDLGEPELLPDNRGWTWGQANGSRIEIRFDPPPPSVFFEMGRKSEIRVFLYKGKIAKGRRHYVATVTLSNDMAIGQTTAERYGLDDENTWPTDILDVNTVPVDLSFLNASEKPAGKHGFLTVVDERLVFEDGTPVHFWGTNLTAGALFGTAREEVKRQARHLSELGFNLVRIHHHDSPWVVPNIFGDGTAPDTQNLSAASLEKLDWWIKCLEDEGIYVWLDLHDGRQLKAADHIDNFGEISKGKPAVDLKGYNYVNYSIKRAMLHFNEEYLDHRNVFNGLPYKSDPGIAAFLLTNENDVTHHFGNALLPNQDVPQHSALYIAQADAFASKFELPKDDTWRSWEQGPSKLFLNDLEHRFDVDLIERLRALGVKAPIVTTSSWGEDPLSSLPALLTGNIVDVHAYGGVDELQKSPIFAPTLVDWMAAAHVANRPLSVTEWNVSPFPAPDRHAIPLYVASASRLQGWNAVMQFAYSQEPLGGRGSPSNWEFFNDPALMATMPAAALLYRRGDVQESKTAYVFAPTPQQLFDQLLSPETSVALRTAAEKGKLLIAMPQARELPWLVPSQTPTATRLITNPNESLIDVKAGHATSDTGELRRDWEQGTYTIDTSRTQAAMGWIGGKQIKLADVEVAVTTQNATLAVQSLDHAGISESDAILISLGARSIPDHKNRMPFHSEPVLGHLAIRARKGLRLYKQESAEPRLGSSVRVERELPVSYERGWYHIRLDRSIGTYWLFLK